MSEPAVARAVEVPAEKTRRSDARETLRTLGIVLLFAAGFAIVPRLMHGIATAKPAEDAPVFAAEVVANGAAYGLADKVDLASLKGKPVILDFFATWCGPCQAEMPIVNGLAQRYKNDGLVVLGVNTSDEPGLAPRFAKQRGVKFPFLYDKGNAIAERYGVTNLPTLIVLTKDGKILAVRHGITSDADLESLVHRVL